MRTAASITPPLAPKSLPAVDRSPNGVSAVSAGMAARSSPRMRMILASSRVVSTASTSATVPSPISERPHSNFLAVQGMIETLNILEGSMPSRWAK